jgi:hypothetical protein
LSLLVVGPSDLALSADVPEAGPSKVRGGLAYRPPLRGAPAARIGGGIRGTDDALTVSVLAPDHTGWTISSAPTLYWYLSKPATSRVEVTVTTDEVIDPVLEETVEAPLDAGFAALDLAAKGVELKPGVEYQWFVSVVPDASQRSVDIISGGAIERVDPSPALKGQLAGASPRTKPQVYAGEGIWYDAIASLSSLIEKNPGDRGLREQRASLLEQVGLSEAADYDRRGTVAN